MASTTSESLTNWLELPSDIMINILCRVDVIDIFEKVEKVCTTWHKICKDHPALWRVIKMDGFPCYSQRPRFREICKFAVDRSQGQLVDLTIVSICDDELLLYIADRSSQLRRLEIACCSVNMYGGWNDALKKFPLLEELNLYTTKISKEAIQTAGLYWPMLKTLKVNRKVLCKYSWATEDVEEFIMIGNEFAKTIGENLVGLRHLELIGCSMSNVGLQGILDGCCHLESLDLRNCWHIDLEEDLQRRCSEQLKHLTLPDDSLEGCPYINKYYGLINPYANYAIKPWLFLDDDGSEDYGDFEDFLDYDDNDVLF